MSNKTPKNLLIYSDGTEYQAKSLNIIKDETPRNRVNTFVENMIHLFLAIEKSGIMTINDKYILVFSMFEDEKQLLVNDLETTNYIRERDKNKFTLINGFRFIINTHE